MGNTKTYLLDANVFIHAYRQYYAFDIAPFFWNFITEHAGKNRIISISPIKDELKAFGEEDELASWAVANFDEWFKPIDDDEVVSQFGNLMEWAEKHKQFLPVAKAEFATVADAWLIAYAKANNCVLVTHETHKPDVKKRIPIPNVCHEHDVEYMNTFQMIRELGIQFG